MQQDMQLKEARTMTRWLSLATALVCAILALCIAAAALLLRDLMLAWATAPIGVLLVGLVAAMAPALLLVGPVGQLETARAGMAAAARALGTLEAETVVGKVVMAMEKEKEDMAKVMATGKEGMAGMAGTVASTETRGMVMEEDTYEKPPHGWTCFHCGETFMTVGSAKNHFGETPASQPGCLVRVGLGGERGLLLRLREVEDELTELYQRRAAEDTELHREIHRIQGRHANAIIDAEIVGYERGLRDGRAMAALGQQP